MLIGPVTAEFIIAEFERLRDLVPGDRRLIAKIERLLFLVRRRQMQLALAGHPKHEPTVEEVIAGCEQTAALAERLGDRRGAAGSWP